MSRPLTYTISITCSLHLTTVFKLDSLFVSLPSPLAMLLPQGPPNTRKLCIHPEIRNKNPACLCGKPGAQEKENLFRWIIHHDSPWFLDILRNHTEGGKPSGPELDKEKWIHLSGLIIFAVTASVHGETQHMSPANVIGKKKQKHVPLLWDLMEVGTEYKHF